MHTSKPAGCLYGVGVGPGDPDLMTLKAIATLRTADVLAIPRKDARSTSTAWRIAEQHVGPIAGQTRLFLNFPMTKDPTVLGPAWDAVLEQLTDPLSHGARVAFITEGDPLVYSTFIYLQARVRSRFPALPIEVIPGVTSLSAVPAVLGLPLADGQQRVAVIPASYGLDDLPAILATFDTVLLMKVTKVMPQLIELLQNAGLLEQAVYVSRATMHGQQIITDLQTMRQSRCDYFSMVMVATGKHSGVLAGTPLRTSDAATGT